MQTRCLLVSMLGKWAQWTYTTPWPVWLVFQLASWEVEKVIKILLDIQMK